MKNVSTQSRTTSSEKRISTAQIDAASTAGVVIIKPQ